MVIEHLAHAGGSGRVASPPRSPTHRSEIRHGRQLAPVGAHSREIDDQTTKLSIHGQVATLGILIGRTSDLRLVDQLVGSMGSVACLWRRSRCSPRSVWVWGTRRSCGRFRLGVLRWCVARLAVLSRHLAYGVGQQLKRDEPLLAVDDRAHGDVSRRTVLQVEHHSKGSEVRTGRGLAINFASRSSSTTSRTSQSGTPLLLDLQPVRPLAYRDDVAPRMLETHLWCPGVGRADVASL
jgi:hypothetical protein